MRPALLALLTIACSPHAPGGSGGGAGGGVGGYGGGAAGGAMDAGGGSGTCNFGQPTGEGACLHALDGGLIVTFGGTVTVVSIDVGQAGACVNGASGSSTLLTLESSDHQRFVVEAQLPGLPGALVQAGESLELSVESEQRPVTTTTVWQQSLSISRGTDPLIFAWFGVGVPDHVGSAGVQRQPPLCSNECCGCRFDHTPLRFTLGSQQVTVDPGATAAFGAYDVTVYSASLASGSTCDFVDSFRFAGVKAR